MARLIKKIALFALINLAVIGIFVVAGKHATHNMLAHKAFVLDSSVHTLIVGDSHAETSLDPDLLSGSVNIAKSGENVFYTYYKLKHFLDANPHNISKVILSVSYHNISKKYQEAYLFDDLLSAYAFENYYVYLDNEAKDIISESKNYLLYRLKYDAGLPLKLYQDRITIKTLLRKNLTKSDITSYGGYIRKDVSDLDPNKIQKKVKKYYFDDTGRYTGTSDIMVSYVHKLIDLCQRKGILVVLFNAPVNYKYKHLVPKNALAEYDKMISGIMKQHDNIIYADMTDYLLEDKLFSDGDHLNHLGASQASRKLAAILN